jgi:signal transduction histidine kinase
MAVVLVTILVMTVTMTALLRAERRSALENEMFVQARDLAQLMSVLDVSSFWRFDPATASGAAITRKIEDIQNTYQAEVWLVNASGVGLTTGDSKNNETLNDERVVEQIKRVLSGEEIRTQNLPGTSVAGAITIGVPWYGVLGGRVLGAILITVDGSALDVDYSELIRYSVLAGLAALALSSVLVFLIARAQSRPIRQITDAVQAFAHGDFSRRVEGIKGDGDVARLADSFNAMAEDISRLDQSRKSFVANVSHELRSPMTCIQGYVQGMLDGTIRDDEREKYLNTVLSETKRLTKLIAELLDLSRFEAGKTPLNKTRFDIDELILSVLFKFEKRIEDKGIDVEISFKEQPCYVEADADRITQVITNLIDNAVKFAAEKGQLIVWTHVVDNLCYVTVKNDGAAIPADDLPFIFERFYKVDKAHTSGGGTGLGLAIVKRILEQHGQSINVTSTGGLTTFVFTLERAKDNKALPAGGETPTDETEKEVQ